MPPTKPAGPLIDRPGLYKPTTPTDPRPAGRPSRGSSPAPARWVHVNLGEINKYIDEQAGVFGTRVRFRVVTDDEQALWRFFDVRKPQFTEGLRSVVHRATGGKAVLERVDYEHGSLMIVMLIVAVVGQYPQIKNNLPIIMSDIEEVIRWIEESVIPDVKEWITQFFEEYKESPLVRLGKSIWNTLFG